MPSFRLPEEAKIVEGLNPATDAAGRIGYYITTKNAGKVFIVCHLTQGNAATVQFSVNQATSGAGTTTGAGAKALSNPVPIWYNLDTSLSDTLVLQAAAVNFTPDAFLKNKLVVFEIQPEVALDLVGGFKDIAIQTGPSNAGNITEALYYVMDERYSGSNPPTAFVD